MKTEINTTGTTGTTGTTNTDNLKTADIQKVVTRADMLAKREKNLSDVAKALSGGKPYTGNPAIVRVVY